MTGTGEEHPHLIRGTQREGERSSRWELTLGDQGSAPSTPAPALQRLRGTANVVGELAELEEERAACQGQRARRPWELFQDRGLRRQVTSLVVLGSALELCGNDSVRPPSSPTPGRDAADRSPPAARPSAPPLQVYAYASSVFREAGIPKGKVQYAVLGTGSCELLAACLSVSLSWARADPPPALRGRGGVGG